MDAHGRERSGHEKPESSASGADQVSKQGGCHRELEDRKESETGGPGEHFGRKYRGVVSYWEKPVIYLIFK